MKVEQHPDGWHVIGDRGEHVGPIASLNELQDVMDNVEFHLRIAAERQRQAPAPVGELSQNPLPKFNV